MSCNSHSSCGGTDYKQLELMIKNILFDMLNDGTIQPGLKACEGDDFLGKSRRVVLCESLADMICDLIEKGMVCIPKVDALTFDCGTKQLTMSLSGGGSSFELNADLSCLAGSAPPPVQPPPATPPDGNTKIRSVEYDEVTGNLTITDTDGGQFTANIKFTPVTNKSMGWDADKQVVSVTDTKDKQVSIPVVFPKAITPPVGPFATPKNIIGKSTSVVLGEPGDWMQFLTADGRVGRVPVYFDDVVAPNPIPACPMIGSEGGGIPATFGVFGFVKGLVVDTDADHAVRHFLFDPYPYFTDFDTNVAGQYQSWGANSDSDVMIKTNIGWFVPTEVQNVLNGGTGTVDSHYGIVMRNQQGELFIPQSTMVKQAFIDVVKGNAYSYTENCKPTETWELKMFYRLEAPLEARTHSQEFDMEELQNLNSMERFRSAMQTRIDNFILYIRNQAQSLFFLKTPWGYIKEDDMVNLNTPGAVINLITLDNEEIKEGETYRLGNEQPSGFIIRGGDVWTFECTFQPQAEAGEIPIDPLAFFL